MNPVVAVIAPGMMGAAVATAARQSEAEIAERTADNAAVAFSATGSAP